MCQFEIGALDKGLLDLLVSYCFVRHFAVSSLCLKCTEHVGRKTMLFSEECMWEQKVGRLKELGERV